MIASIRGRLTRKAADYLVVDVSGVGYQVSVPLSTFCALPEPGGEVSLHIHTHLREDSLSLFGFITHSEKDVFQLLLNVSGIGPKLALAVLSGLPVTDLCSAIRESDDSKLCKIPGIGRKTAARMVLELRDKMPSIPAGSSDGKSVPEADDREDALSALMNLGYKKQTAEEALRKVGLDKPGLRLEELLRDALACLGKRT